MALAGLVSGFAIGLKPSTSVFLAGPAVALAITRRYRGAAVFALAIAPAVVTLTVWKYRGLGTLPIFSGAYGATELAAGVQSGFDHVATVRLYKYVNLDWHHLSQNLDGIREYFWSNRLVEWIPIAGALGAFRRSPPKATFLGGLAGCLRRHQGNRLDRIGRQRLPSGGSSHRRGPPICCSVSPSSR